MSKLNSGESSASDDEDTLASDTSNALLNEMDRYTGTSFGQPVPPGYVVTSTGLDRDFYARCLAASLDSSPERLKAALEAVKGYSATEGSATPSPDERQYAAAVAGVDPNDDAAVLAAYFKGWQDMAENLVTRALHIIDTTNGPVKAPSALAAFGLEDE